MSKTDPTPEAPPERLCMSMREFSFFAKNKKSYLNEIKKIVDAGHTLTLYMTQSTSLSNDLYILNSNFARHYRIEYGFRKDEYDKAQVIVYLEQEVA